MMGSELISIILCTSNRSAGLRRTFESLSKVRVRSEWKVELIVVDNASTDDTAAVVRKLVLSNIEVRYVYEGKRGKANALNAGLAQAGGDIMLFTDDDVLLAEDWAEEIVSALLNENCDAVTGEITLASHLVRPWLGRSHRWWLASSNDAQLHEGSRELIGANMGFKRSVLERVPGFDPELGPGALGLGEDTLFGWQLVEAGFKIEYVPKAKAIHQLDASRLRRRNWLNEARKHGGTEAYVLYHWLHGSIKAPRLEWLKCWTKLHLNRLLRRPPGLEEEGCPRWELSCVLNMEKCRQFCAERRRARNYSYRGLIKRGAPALLRQDLSPTAVS